MFVEGQKVVYAGDSDPFNEVGAAGRVVALSGDAAHVQWTGGPKVGSIDLVEMHELVGDRNQVEAIIGAPHEAYFESSLSSAPLASETAMQVRASYDAQGESGALIALDESGHLASLAGHADGVVWDLIGKIRADAAMHGVLSQLETDEADVVVSKIATTLLIDRLKEI